MIRSINQLIPATAPKPKIVKHAQTRQRQSSFNQYYAKQAFPNFSSLMIDEMALLIFFNWLVSDRVFDTCLHYIFIVT